MTARKTLVGPGSHGERPDPEERKVPDYFGDVSQETPESAPEHSDVDGDPPPAPGSKDSEPRGPKSR